MISALGAQPGRTRYSRRDKPTIGSMSAGSFSIATNGRFGGTTATASGIYTPNDGRTFDFMSSGTVVARVDGNGLGLTKLGLGVSGGSPTVFLSRDSSDVLALANGTNTQAFNLYSTFTARGSGTTNLEYISTKAQTSGNYIIQSTRGNIGGSSHDIEFRTGAVDTNGVIINGDLSFSATASGLKLGSWTSSTIPTPVGSPFATAAITDSAPATPGTPISGAGSLGCMVQSDGAQWLAVAGPATYFADQYNRSANLLTSIY